MQRAYVGVPSQSPAKAGRRSCGTVIPDAALTPPPPPQRVQPLTLLPLTPLTLTPLTLTPLTPL